MATDKELSGFIINEIESDDKLSKISQEQTLAPNQIFMTKDGIISDNAVGLPIGAIFASAIPITDSRVHLLDGSYIAQDGVYEEFAELIKSLDASGQPIACSEDDFERDVTNTGNCGKFVINNQTRTIRLPKITKFIQGLDNISNIGTSLQDEFKSHNHDVGPICTNGNAGLAYTQVSNGVSPSWDGTGNGYTKYVNNTGGSETRPKATQFPYYIVLASGYKSKKSVNIDNIMGEVRRKPFIDNIYPVGSIYLTLSENFSPARAFGGTWEQLKDCFLWGAGDTKSITYTENGTSVTKSLTVGQRGGETTHKLTEAEMPSHSHKETWAGKDGIYYTYELTYNSGSSWGMNVTRIASATPANTAGSSYLWTRGAGSSGVHNNMPPYLAVYMWKRLPDDENGSEVENYPYYGDGSGSEIENY